MSPVKVTEAELPSPTRHASSQRHCTQENTSNRISTRCSPGFQSGTICPLEVISRCYPLATYLSASQSQKVKLESYSHAERSLLGHLLFTAVHIQILPVAPILSFIATFFFPFSILCVESPYLLSFFFICNSPLAFLCL